MLSRLDFADSYSPTASLIASFASSTDTVNASYAFTAPYTVTPIAAIAVNIGLDNAKAFIEAPSDFTETPSPLKAVPSPIVDTVAPVYLGQ